MPITLAQRPKISAGDIDVVSVDYSPYLDSGELLASVTSVSEIDSSDLTISSTQVSTVQLAILDNPAVLIGQAAQCKVVGQKAGKVYRLRFTVLTNATVARTKVVDVIVTCVP